jgi:Peptidase family M28
MPFSQFSLSIATVAMVPVIALAQGAELPLKHAPRPTSPAISAGDLMTRLYVFADDSMMGREAGTEYNLKGTAYIEREVRRLGLVPGGDGGTYFQDLPLASSAIAPRSAVSVQGRKFAAGMDFIPRDNAVFGKVRSVNGAPVIYGGVFSPQMDTSKMVSAQAAAGKLVVMSLPVGADGKLQWRNNRQPLTGFYIAAAGVAVVGLDAIDGNERPTLVEPTMVMQTSTADAMTVPAYVYVSQTMGEALMGGPLSGLSRGAPGRAIQGEIAFELTRAPARNVIAILPGSDPALKGQYVAMGAHNDHIGFTSEPVDHDSLRAFNAVVRPTGADDPWRNPRAEERPRIKQILDSLRKIRPARLDSIYNGADDDGSGTVSVLEIAEAFASAPVKPKRSMIFVWHTGEEKGLWGSQYFTDHPTVPRDSIVAQLNIDMVGRGGAQDLSGGGPGYLQLIGSRRLSTELGDLVESVAKTEPIPFRFDYQYDANGHPEQYYCRSDHYEYARYGIPITFFSTGGHRDYHQVTDEPQYIDYDQMSRVATLIHDVALRVADLDHRIVVNKSKPNPRAQCVQ